MTENFWGLHSLFDCVDCNKEKISSYDNIMEFTRTLVDAIDMKAYGEPMLERFCMDDPDRGGYSLAQMIETSLIDGHFVEAKGEAYISVNSCKDYNPEVVRHVIGKYFNPSIVYVQTLHRRSGE